MASSSIPDDVRAALQRAEDIRFDLSSEEVAGRLLATLAAAVPKDGRILEIGTGVGVGTAWICTGLGYRTDVHIVSVEIDPTRAAAARAGRWPSHVRLIEGSVFDLYDGLGQFDLIFADSGAGKWDGRARTIAAIKPGGVLLMDDMTPPRWKFDRHEALNAEVRADLLNRPDLVATEIAVATGILIAVKRRNSN